MYYQFNNFTGRLIGSTQFQPYFPISAKPLNKSEPPPIIFSSKDVRVAPTGPSVRHASQKTIPGTNVQFGELSESMKRKMELFQRRDGVPVHLKGGALDKGLYGLTIALCGIGLVGTFHFFYERIFTKNN